MKPLLLALALVVGCAGPARASCAFRAAAIATASGTGTGVTMTAPPGAADGDILLAVLYFENTSDTLTLPGSWALIRSDNNAGANPYRVALSWIRRSGAPALNFAWTTSVFFQYIISAYTGCLAAGTPTDGSNFGNATSISPYRVTTFSTTVNGDVLIAINNTLSGCIPTPPAGYTSRQNSATGSQADLQQATAGATGNVDYTSGGCGSEQWLTQIVALKQAAAAACTPTMPLLGVGRCG